MEKPPPAEPDDLFFVGKIVSAHGIRGGVNVQVWTDRDDRFQVGRELWSLSDRGNIPLIVERVRKTPRGLIVRFEHIENRSQADQLSGTVLAISGADRGDPEEGTYYVSDLLGCQVYTDDDHVLGKIADVTPLAHHDLYVVVGPYGEILIPVVQEYIQSVDIDHRRIVVRNLEAFWDGIL